jgi:hypothetical protein
MRRAIAAQTPELKGLANKKYTKNLWIPAYAGMTNYILS